ncbi:exonuclease domain-containing protein, partial [Arthrobacter sp. H5]|uniref:exonuclease domain-containing protein n=1 Tax=Arthrobacter sp. H5 TaxID=1267973 RepID=UPI000561AB48
VPIPEEAAAIHGISTAAAQRNGLPSARVTAEVAAVIAGLFREGIPVLAFNARYDFTVLATEGTRHGVAVPIPRPVLDPFIMDKQVDRFRRGKRTLTAMCEHYGVTLNNAHTSAADVLATLQVAAVLAARYPYLQQPAGRLHDSQISWAARQAASFQDYLRKTDPAAVVEGRWPAIAS